MKKIMRLFVYVAAAAMTLASCQKNEIDGPVKKDVHFTIKAGIETKTSIVEGDGVYTPQWDGEEELGLLFALPNGETTVNNVVKLKNTKSGYLASFEGAVSDVEPTGTFYSFYPASAFSRGYKEGDARLDLNNEQKPTATSFDPSCDILVAKPYDYVVEEGEVVAEGLEFARIMSVLRIDLKSEFADVQNEFVKSVSFTAGDVDITGYARIFLENPEFTDNWASSGNQWHTVTAKYDSDVVSINGTSNSVYLVIAPVTIPADNDLTFEIKTKSYNITKTIKSPEMKFTAGKISKINLTIVADNCEKIDESIDYSGEYLIAGKHDDRWYAAKKYISGNFLSASEIVFEGENIIKTEDIADHYMNIQKVVGGDYDGMYTIQDADGKYLSTSSSDSNYMKAEEALSEHTYWTIEKDDEKGTYSMVASQSQNRNDMRFNYNNGSPRVSCYDGSKTNLPYLFLFSKSLVKEDTTPRISVTETTYSVFATETSVVIPYTVKNITGTITATVADGATMVNVKTAVTDDKVTVTFNANDDSQPRTATVVLSYEGATDVNVTITQAGKSAEGGEIATWSWAGGVKADFEKFNGVEEVHGLGSDYAESNAPYRTKLDDTGDYFIIKVDGAIQSVSVGVKMVGGANTSYLDIQGSTDGESFTTVQKLTISGSPSDIINLTTTNTFDASYRYVKFYFTKGSNVGVGPITITYIPDNNAGGSETPEPETKELKSIAVSNAKTNYVVGDEFVKPNVTATYDDDSTKDVTASATFGGYDMSASGTQTVTVSYTEGEKNATATYQIEVVAQQDLPKGITAIKKEAASTDEADFAVTLTDAVVTYVSGKNAYIEDAEAGILVYNENHGLAAGDKLNGTVSGKVKLYSNLREITQIDWTKATKDAGAEIPVTVLTLAELNADGAYDKYENMRIKIVDATVSATKQISQGDQTYALYFKGPSLTGFDLYNIIDVIGYPSKFNDAIQFNVWENAVFKGATKTTITGISDVTVKVGETKAINATASSEAKVSYVSANPSVATVAENGTVTGVTEGETTITVSVLAYNGYPAAEETCKVTVTAASQGGEDVSTDPVTISTTMTEIVSKNNYTISAGNSATCYTSIALDNVITMSTSGSANCGSFWGSDTQDWRLYQNKKGDVTISASSGYIIKSVKFTFKNSNNGTLNNGSAQLSSGSKYDVNSSSVTYTVANSGTATNGQIRISAIEVVYQAN